MLHRIAKFLREVRAELGKVSWPTRRQLFLYTGVVVGLCFAFAIYLGGINAVATWLIGKLVVR